MKSKSMILMAVMFVTMVLAIEPSRGAELEFDLSGFKQELARTLKEVDARFWAGIAAQPLPQNADPAFDLKGFIEELQRSLDESEARFMSIVRSHPDFEKHCAGNGDGSFDLQGFIEELQRSLDELNSQH